MPSKAPSKAELFLRLAQPDPETGFSKPVPIGVLEENGLGFGNGGSWCRDSSALAQIYNVERIKRGNRIIAVKLNGLNKTPIAKPIPINIRRKMKTKRCVVLGTGAPECDHKDGRLDNPRLNDVTRVGISDFQPLSKAANAAKRQHCKACRDTNKRFDARKLGFKHGQWAGNGRYMGTCVGCYWHDPRRFNEEASAGWEKNEGIGTGD